MDRLGLVLQRVQNTFNRNVDRYARSLGLTGTQMLIIEYFNSFASKGSIYQKDIEREFNIRKSTATNILRLMEQNGLIVRKVDARDSRLKKILLTDRAKELEQEITTYFVNSEEMTARILGQTIKNELMANLQKLNEALAEK
ncbi:MarR family transcriptional regulator [Lactobacillus sp. XV13L]|nr:MarR family transcriptional regulator [Lactobacillus sp. XV13L]